jgi:RNA polymerase sigma-70 factor (ECF subfamily)
MLRFAQLQLRNRETAEDMVQEAIESALRNASSFAGNSSLKTWVFTILKNRIIDHLRQAGRTVPMSSLVDEGDDWQERLERVRGDLCPAGHLDQQLPRHPASSPAESAGLPR